MMFPKSTQPLNTIADIEAHPVYGMAVMNIDLVERLNKIIVNHSKDLGVRFAAYNKINEINGTGIVVPSSVQDIELLLENHISELPEYGFGY